MRILIANIGTSDLSVKVDKDENLYFPIGFERNEKNIDFIGITEDERTAWDSRDEFVGSQLCSELGVETSRNQKGEYQFSFRELTKKLLDAYNHYPDFWHKRISPGRIWGVIYKAYKEFNIKEAYIFITNQKPEHQQDTIYLFEILKKWLENELPDFYLNSQTLPEHIKPSNVDFDQILNYYHSFFQEKISGLFHTPEVTLVSIKGGTPQMQTALKLQSISSKVQNLLFIDPILSVTKILSGEASECQLASYWKYFRQQKYQTVNQLLERWDFDGAIKILQDWRQILKFFRKYNTVENEAIANSLNKINVIIDVLDCSRSIFNLDVYTARKIIHDNQTLIEDQNFLVDDLLEINSYDSLLNLYTQCIIYQELRQTANFLTTLSSFFEGVLARIIEKNGGNQYLTENDTIKLNKLKQNLGDTVCQEFEQELNKLKGSQLSGRKSQKLFVYILLKHSQVNKSISNRIQAWEQDEIKLDNGRQLKGLSGLLESLNYWVNKRNKLIHNADGVSIQRINELDKQRPDEACAYQEILDVMSKILLNQLLQLKNDYKKRFIGTKDYYIYSNAKNWVIAQLAKDV